MENIIFENHASNFDEQQEYNITEMTFSDLEGIKNILITDFDEFWNYDVFKEDLNSENSKYIVAKTSNNTIIGFLGIKTILDESELMNVVTRKSMRNKGVASCLLSYIITFCKENGQKRLNLEVNCQNTLAIKLYKKYNFKEVGYRKKYYNNTYDAILMTLFLR